MIITSIPAELIAAFCRQLTAEDKLQDLVGGQLVRTLRWYVNEDDFDDYPYIAMNEGGTDENVALMLWIADQSNEPVTLGCLWDSGWAAGIIALSGHLLVRYTVAHDAIHQLQKQACMESVDSPVDEIAQLRNEGKSEDEIDLFISHWSEDYYPLVRDSLQLELLKATHDRGDFAINDIDYASTNYPFLKMLSENGHTLDVEDLGESLGSMRALLQPID